MTCAAGSTVAVSLTGYGTTNGGVSVGHVPAAVSAFTWSNDSRMV